MSAAGGEGDGSLQRGKASSGSLRSMAVTLLESLGMSRATVEGEHSRAEKPRGDKKKSKTVWHPELSRWTYWPSIKWAGPIPEPDQPKRSPYEMCSVNEAKVQIIALAEAQADEMRQHNAWTLSRTYPEKWRQDSSNMDPTYAWGVGSQMVCLNFQTWDMGMRLNHAKFSLNGGCGYVLKPLWQREKERPPELAQQGGAARRTDATLAGAGAGAIILHCHPLWPEPEPRRGSPALPRTASPSHPCSAPAHHPSRPPRWRRESRPGRSGDGRTQADGNVLQHGRRCPCHPFLIRAPSS